ncbi:hypothetical protein K491DRAFT_109518 [Lophiostoma macrostomum CBS 122681]|uniref:Uncharacterized protein n=1 Tax=Lophiostoma macrostomum CBS 122681 TaxID=1314788 RepID=A0A6A6TKV3_9PLEO|nr:hypothetical protein K491DRAFT_109518 [Lophiostoma macrostomum CBS 122681]
MVGVRVRLIVVRTLKKLHSLLALTIQFPCLAMQNNGEWMDKKMRYKEAMQDLASQGPAVGLHRVGLYLERTLDEAYYPSLDVKLLDIRNKDQVIQKQQGQAYANMQRTEASLPILMVPQLWLWRISNILVSAYSVDVRGEGSEYPSMWRPGSADVQMAYVMKDGIENFGRAYYDRRSGTNIPPTLGIFETAVVAVLSDVRNYLIHRQSQNINIAQETKFLESIADIQNELDMIETIIEQQENIISAFADDLNSQNAESEEKMTSGNLSDEEQKVEATRARDRQKALQVLNQGTKCLQKYKKQIEKINRDASRVAKSIDDMLNLSRTEASIQLAQSSITEAQNSIKMARYSLFLGLAALAFAVVTIIFTPLSFVTSLLALPIGADDRVYKSSYVRNELAEFTTLVGTALLVWMAYASFEWNNKRREDKEKAKEELEAKLKGKSKEKPKEQLKEQPEENHGEPEEGHRPEVERKKEEREQEQSEKLGRN